MWTAALEVRRGVPGDEAALATAAKLATLPLRLGGLGLRSAERTAPAAFWASWADVLPMIHQRAPHAATDFVHTLSSPEPRQGCLAEARAADELLSREGFLQRPTWGELKDGKRPPKPHGAEPGEWPHGWQYYASSTREHFFRRDAVFAKSASADCAHLRSHSGRNAGCVLVGAPTAPEYVVEPLEFRTLVLERLRLPLAMAAARCEGCGRPVDAMARHYAACTDSGRVKKRAAAPEQALARVCREAGAVVNCNVFLRDLNVGVSAADGRPLEVLAQGLPCRGASILRWM